MIILKDFDFEETQENVTLTVPLKGVSKKNLDVYCCDLYLKISSPPYIFQCDLFDFVDDDTCTTTISSDSVRVRLVKKKSGIWKQVIAQGRKEEIASRRNEAMERRQKREEEMQKERLKSKREDDRKALRKQLYLEDKEREELQKRKEAAHRNAIAEILDGEEATMPPREDLNLFSKVDVEDNKASESIFSSRSTVEQNSSRNEESEYVPIRMNAPVAADFSIRALPTPARESKLEEEEAYFSKMREHAEAERKDKITTIAQSSSSFETMEDSPPFLKSRGDEFFVNKNYLAALEAYSSAIEKMSSNGKQAGPSASELDTWRAVHLNRAGVYLQLSLIAAQQILSNNTELKQNNPVISNANLCIADCDLVLSLLPPGKLTVSVPGRRARARVLSRKGTAYLIKNEEKKCLELYKEALIFAPDVASMKALEHDISEIESSLSYTKLKNQADSLLADSLSSIDGPLSKMISNCKNSKGRLQIACKLYSDALRLRPASHDCMCRCWLNSSLCYLLLSDWQNVVIACGHVVDVLVRWGKYNGLTVSPCAHCAGLCDRVAVEFGDLLSDEEKNFFVLALLRRGIALSQLCGSPLPVSSISSSLFMPEKTDDPKFYESSAIADYETCVALLPDLPDLRDDLELLKSSLNV